MRPCNCKTMQDCLELKETGLSFNNESISVPLMYGDGVSASRVILEIFPYVRVKFTARTFKRFCEWYLEDQK